MTPLWRYRLLIRLLGPLLLGYTLWRTLKGDGVRYLCQRLGLYRPSARSQQLWIHAASVGEVFTVLPLLRAWLEQHSQANVLLTTGTATGAAVVQQQALNRVYHQYLPVDFPGACKRFIAQVNAEKLWVVETEIWPWLYAQCQRQSIAITIINGRLSDRTSKQATGLLGSSYQRALHNVQILARSAVDHDKFIKLGAQPTHVQTVGNLKYASSERIHASSAPLSLPYVLAASTHDDEELQLAEAWQRLKPANTLLVIVPRHPERGGRIEQQFKTLGLRVAQRSQGQQPDSTDTVYLADTLGELDAWYAHAQASFVGGSLIPRGGHNVLEPARHACPTVVGTYTDNFDDIVSIMKDRDALFVAGCVDEVTQFLQRGANHDPALITMGQQAKTIARESESVLQHYLQLLNRPG